MLSPHQLRDFAVAQKQHAQAYTRFGHLPRERGRPLFARPRRTHGIGRQNQQHQIALQPFLDFGYEVIAVVDIHFAEPWLGAVRLQFGRQFPDERRVLRAVRKKQFHRGSVP